MSVRMSSIVLLALTLLALCFLHSGSCEKLSEGEFISTTLRYVGELSLRATGRVVRDVLGDIADQCNITTNEVHISIRYVLIAEVLFKPGFSIRVSNITLDRETFEVLSNNQCFAEIMVKTLKTWEPSMPGVLADVPLVLNLRRGAIELNYVKREGAVVGITRYGGIDIVQVKNDFIFNSLTSGNVVYGMDLYYEPISKIPVHYVEVLSTRLNENSLTSTIFVTLHEPNLDYSELFAGLIGRRVFEILVNTTDSNTFTTYKTYLAIIYARDQGIDPSISVEIVNNTVHVTVSPLSTCLIVLGPLRDPVENSTIYLDYYTTRAITGLQYVYYTSEPIKCGEISVRLRASSAEYYNETSHPEVLPPPRSSIYVDTGGYVVVAFTMGVTMLILYVLCGYAAKRLTHQIT